MSAFVGSRIGWARTRMSDLLGRFESAFRVVGILVWLNTALQEQPLARALRAPPTP